VENSAIAIEFWAPVVQLVGWSVTGGFQTGAGGPTSASGTNIVNVKIGARMGFGGHSSLYVGYGGPVTSAIGTTTLFESSIDIRFDAGVEFA
jgi:hypothetical protein